MASASILDSARPFREPCPRVTVAMLGARMHYAVPRLLYEAGLLERFYTDSYIGNKPWLEAVLKAIPSPLRPSGVQRWLGRRDTVLPAEKVKSFEALGLWYAWVRYWARTFAQKEIVTDQTAKRFNRRIVATGLGKPEVVWGFNTSALELFQVAKGRGARCILEQTILPRHKELALLREEIQRWPDWEPGLIIPKTGSIVRAREEQEWALADCIVAGSEFVRNGLLECGVPEMKIRVVPYGVDTRRFPAQPLRTSTSRGGPLRLLFAGFVGLRKGIPDLLQALRWFKPGEVEAQIAGSVSLDDRKLEWAGDGVRFLGKVPRSDMLQLYQWADVVVLPSIVEGSATVTYEALMSGVPVITTPNAGSIVQDGVDGFIVPIRDPESLAGAIARYHEDRTLLARHQTATAESRQRAGLDRYRADLVRLVRDIMQS